MKRRNVMAMLIAMAVAAGTMAGCGSSVDKADVDGGVLSGVMLEVLEMAADAGESKTVEETESGEAMAKVPGEAMAEVPAEAVAEVSGEAAADNTEGSAGTSQASVGNTSGKSGNVSGNSSGNASGNSSSKSGNSSSKSGNVSEQVSTQPHIHEWKPHTAQRWVSNMVTVVDQPEKYEEYVLYKMYWYNTDTWEETRNPDRFDAWYYDMESGPLSSKALAGPENNPLFLGYNELGQESYINDHVIISNLYDYTPAVTHQEDQGYYEEYVDYLYCDCGMMF